MDNKSATADFRRYISHITPFNSNIIQKINPLVPMWWSAAFPGLGHMMLNQHLKGFILFSWEIFINLNSRLNLAILYSFTGEFDLAKQIANPKWILLYMPIYIAGIWDSYRLSVDINKLHPLIKKEGAPIVPFNLTSTGFNFLDKRNPIIAALWSFFSPGLGHLYIHRLNTGLFLLTWFIITIYQSNILLATHLLFLGDFNGATAILNPQWIMFMPSIYGFALYDSYRLAVQNNILFKEEQAHYLQKKYQDSKFTISLEKAR